MAIAVDDIVTRAGDILLDAAHTRWTVAELLRYISDGQRQVVNLIPAACTRTVAVGLGNNSLQLLPTGYLRLVDLVCNTNSAGLINGRPIRKIDRDALDSEDMNWQSRIGTGVIELCVYEPEKDPSRYFVYPQPKVGLASYVSAILSVDLPDVTAGSPLSINPKYQSSLIDYVLARCFNKDGEIGNDMSRAAWHAQAFMSGLGFKTAGAQSAT